METQRVVNKLLLPLFEEKSNYFLEYSKDILTMDDWYRMYSLIIKATLIKSYEFSLTTIKLNAEGIYFMLPALRGICEEFIVEKFIAEKFSDKNDQNYLITLWHQHGLLKSSIAQWNYFKFNRSSQVIYFKDSFPSDLKKIEDDIKRFFKEKFPDKEFKSVFPSTYFMAKEAGLLELYTYLYHASSTFVHFNPENLLRMSWGNIPHMRFTSSNFKYYYNDFIIYYSALLFCDIVEWQIEKDFLPGFEKSITQSIRTILDTTNHVPELVTFEEMNIGIIERILHFKSPDTETKESSDEKPNLNQQ